MDKTNASFNIKTVITGILAVFCIALTAVLLVNVLFGSGSAEQSAAAVAADVSLMDDYNAFIAEEVSNAVEEAKSVKKVFWIDEDALVAPEPNQECYGQTEDPASLQWLLDEAADLLDGQETLFSTEVEIYPGSKVTYYLDETILAITWKQVIDDFVYTISEVKVAHASQFRRYLADGEYGSNSLYTTTEMASKVNAVVASSADYYRGRKYGIVVYDGQVRQVLSGKHMDTCYIDENGDMLFTYRGEILDVETAQKFVDENNISFSLAFGPILIDNGQRCEHESYALGEVNEEYPRAALCQKGKLHYLTVVANGQGSHWECPTIHVFAAVIDTFGCEKAYTLDGGQTGSIAMDGKLMNPVQSGSQRPISDIIYFATAIPDEE